MEGLQKEYNNLEKSVRHRSLDDGAKRISQAIEAARSSLTSSGKGRDPVECVRKLRSDVKEANGYMNEMIKERYAMLNKFSKAVDKVGFLRIVYRPN